jgi:signal transduction histidine kinase
MARDIITKHDGEILVESSDKGTTFTVKLPRTLTPVVAERSADDPDMDNQEQEPQPSQEALT